MGARAGTTVGSAVKAGEARLRGLHANPGTGGADEPGGHDAHGRWQPPARQSDSGAVNRQGAQDAKLHEPDWELDQLARVVVDAALETALTTDAATADGMRAACRRSAEQRFDAARFAAEVATVIRRAVGP